MKTRFYNILLPKFLRNFDDYLLRNYPVVWRTKAIFVLFYGLVGAVLLFAAGFLYPVDAQDLTVEPTTPIVMGYDNYHLWFVLLVAMGLFYWAYRQYQLGFPFTKMKDTILTLVLYALCFYVLFAFTTPAFRLGTIYKTAYHWIDSKALKQFEQSGIYPYGFVLLDEDEGKDFTNEIPQDTFFQRREAIFKSIYAVEDSLLSYRYQNDTIFWIHWYDNHLNLDKRNLDDYRSYKSNLPSRSYQSSRLYQSNLSNLPYLSYRWSLSSLSNGTSLSSLSDVSYQLYQSSYNTYKNKMVQGFDIGSYPYNFLNIQDSTRIYIYKQDNVTIYRPTLPYSVENAVRSVKHARLYLEEKIYVRHWVLALKYVFLLTTLFFFIPFFSLHHFLMLFIVSLFSAFILAFNLPEKISETTNRNISIIIYLLLPIICCSWLSFLSIKQQLLKGFEFAVQGIFLGVFWVLIGALFIVFRVNYGFKDIIQPPYNLAFYGVQALGVLGAVLTTYVRTLPKQ